MFDNFELEQTMSTLLSSLFGKKPQIEYMPEEASIPTAKLFANFTQVKANANIAILITTGALNPIHKQHIQALLHAKNYLEQEKQYTVLVCYVSPSHDHYVGKKLKSEALDAKQRTKLCELATQEHTHVDVSSWECTRSAFCSFANVTNFHAMYFERNKQFQQQLVKHGCKNWRVFFVCGADLILRGTFTAFSYQRVSVLAMGRHKYKEQCQQVIQQEYSKLDITYVDAEDEIAMSSTDVRNLFKTKQLDKLQTYLDQKCIDYLVQLHWLMKEQVI